MPRCCDNDAANDARPCYASVVVLGHAGSIEQDLRRVEAANVCPCVTTWCRQCKTTSLITTDAGCFPSRSAHHAHYLALYNRLCVNP